MRTPRIMIDAGHGGSDYGSCANGIIEKDVTIELAEKIRHRLLDEFHVHVRLTREADVDMTTAERLRLADRWDADVLLSIHLNDSGSTGYASYIHPDAKETSQCYQQRLHRAMNAIINEQDQGMKQGNFGLLRNAGMPALRTECLSPYHERDAKGLGDFLTRREFIEAHVQGLADMFQLESYEHADVPVAGLERQAPIYSLRINGRLMGAFEEKFGLMSYVHEHYGNAQTIELERIR